MTIKNFKVLKTWKANLLNTNFTFSFLNFELLLYGFIRYFQKNKEK